MNVSETQSWPPAVRPTPVGSEVNDIPKSMGQENMNYPNTGTQYYGQHQLPANISYPYQSAGGYPNQQHPVDQDIINRMNSLLSNIKGETKLSQRITPYSHSSYVPQNYTPSSYSFPTQPALQSDPVATTYDPNKAYTTTTNSYRPVSSYAVPNSSNMQYPTSSAGGATTDTSYSTYGQNSGANYNVQGQNAAAYPQSDSVNQTGSYTQVNANTYYPTGYGPNYGQGQSNAEQNVPAGQVQYHSMQYATSVQHNQLNYSYSSTYSSPNFNTSSAPASDDKYMATGLPAVPSPMQTPYSSAAGIQSYPSSGTPTPQQAGSSVLAGQSYYPNQAAVASQDSHATVTNQTVYNAQTYSASQSAYPASASQGTYPTSIPQPTFSSSTTSATHSTPQGSYLIPQGNYPTSDVYPSGTSGTAYQLGTSASMTTLQSYHGSETGLSNQGYSDSSTGSYLYQTGSGTSINNQSTAEGAYPGYSNYYAPDYNQYSSGAVQPAATVVPPKTKESNIDLLSGLDFTINQAPLIPQQNVMPKPEPSEVKPAESKTSLTKTTPVIEDKPAPTEVNRLSVKILPSKQLSNTDVKNLFKQEIEKYEKYVETLTNKTLSGPTNLDIKWKEIQEKQDSDSQKKIISVARCYPMKNRFADILPYDYSRVELHATKDDYINASYIYDVSPYTPAFIVTQTPTPSTCGDFWTMIKEQQVELIFCVSSDAELGDDIYWPREKGQHLNVLNMVISLQSVIVKSHWVERVISVNVPEKRESCVVMHVQFTSWPGR